MNVTWRPLLTTHLMPDEVAVEVYTPGDLVLGRGREARLDEARDERARQPSRAPRQVDSYHLHAFSLSEV
jgi:hypothetical protein